MTVAPGTISHGFELQRETRVDEIDSIARLYRHRKTGAELLSVIGGDENKVFGVAFRTPPADSSGVAHILEHSVLCGSRKYPVKAPFLEMLKGSLNTFLNAMTYPDKTLYPVASVNLQDFYNLVDVYLDAVLHPRLTPEILQQEGWHYELESPDAPLIYKGVVFNEMKGGYSSPDDRTRRLSQQSLYPDTAYGVDSGGDPSEIPSLTYADFKAFYERHYHPSNAKFFFYGDDEPERRLTLLDGVLSEFSAIEVDSQIALQPRFNAPRKIEHALAMSAAEPSAKQARISVNWMLDETPDPETALALAILSYALVGTPAAPLRKALIDSRLGDDIMATGLNTGLKQPMFGAGLKGIDATAGDQVETLILDTLQNLAGDGIDPATIEAAMNTVEFRLRENNTGSFPRGIAVMMRSLQSWNYDQDALAPLAWGAPLQSIKARLARGERVFEALIRDHLLDNPHRTTVLFTPDPELAAREGAEERARLDAARAAMSDEEVQAVIEQTRVLKRLQDAPDTPEALATLPMLTLKDLGLRNTPIPIEVADFGGTQLVTHDLPTAGVLYFDAGLDLRRLPADLLPFAGLFSRALVETGTAAEDFVALSQRIGRLSGGIRASSMTSVIPGKALSAAWLFLRAKAMPEKAGEMFSILRDVLLTARLDNRARIEQLVSEERAAIEAKLVPGGSFFAGQRLRSNLNEADWAAEQMDGLAQLAFLRQLAADMKSGAADPVAALERIRDSLVDRGSMVCNVTAAGADLKRVEPELGRFLDALPSRSAALPDWPMQQLPRFEGLTISAKVNYVAKGESLPKLGYKPGGAAMVASNWLRGTWLWEKVRVQGGAYGSFTALDRRSGVFAFLSYRDPNLLETIAVYDGAAGFLRKAAGNATELERSIIGTIGQIDSYRLPDAKGFVSLQRHLLKETDATHQALRDEVMTTGPAEIRAFADALDALAAHGRIVVLGSEEAILAANEKLEDRFTMTKIQ
jgi:Zn-dependent M16 (insulinase) family peptidase